MGGAVPPVLEEPDETAEIASYEIFGLSHNELFNPAASSGSLVNLESWRGNYKRVNRLGRLAFPFQIHSRHFSPDLLDQAPELEFTEAVSQTG